MKPFLLLRRQETKNCRAIEFRIDQYGIYLLVLQKEPHSCHVSEWEDNFYFDHELKAGVSYQWPTWLVKRLGGTICSGHATNYFDAYILE